MIAKVAVSAATYVIDKPYDYLLPQPAVPGCRVLIPFGRGNRICEGMILSVWQGEPDKPLKSVIGVLDEEPVLMPGQMKLALWMSRRYFCTVYDAIRTILPAGIWYNYKELWSCGEDTDLTGLTEREKLVCRALREETQDTKALQDAFGADITGLLRRLEKRGILSVEMESSQRVRDKVDKLVSLAVSAEEALSTVEARRRSAPRQYDAVEYLCRYGAASARELCYLTGVSRKALRVLQQQGLIALTEQEVYRISEKDYAVKADPIALNEEQQQVYDTVLAQACGGEAGVTLLHGVTGSGKTAVYIRLAQALLARGKSVMILVPEIALTPQMMARFSAYFGDEVALLHSGLRMTERYDQYKRIRRGEVRIVLGTRSAVFAPLVNLGLIVLDEEQESSYESENSPCYHARDIAKYRCFQEGGRLLLGSATPTVETMYNARQGNYHLALLQRRYNQKALPRVMVEDMRRELREGRVGVISRRLEQELRQNIEAGEQSILFLNRRGSSRLLCPECGYVPQCRHCSVYLTYHSANDRLMCHHCGYSEKAADDCPECGGQMKHLGVGTQKVEEDLRKMFPGVEILRMDADTVGGEHERLLHRFEKEKIPILLGTQMVAKGLDFEGVTLVGVLLADTTLYMDHYRAAERTFSLLTQVVGRAGRGERTGRAVIQTYTPENEVIQAAAGQDYEKFYESELCMRRLRDDPPFSDHFTITVTGVEEQDVLRASVELACGLNYTAETPQYVVRGWEVFGPAPAPVVKVSDQYRYHIHIVGTNDAVLRGVIADFMRQFLQRKENRGLHIYVDNN